MSYSEKLSDVVNDVINERFRQEALVKSGKFKWTCAEFAPAITDEAKLAVLAEEFGEVARLVTEQVIDRVRRNPRELKKELIQVAAVAVAWCEAIDKELDA